MPPGGGALGEDGAVSSGRVPGCSELEPDGEPVGDGASVVLLPDAGGVASFDDEPPLGPSNPGTSAPAPPPELLQAQASTATSE